MAKAKLLDPLKRRVVLYGKDTPREVLIHYGDLYLEAGRPNDAVEFYGRAGDRERLLKIKDLALETGDAFLLGQVEAFLGEEFPEEVWGELGRRAKELGKYAFAQKAFARAGDVEALREVQDIMDREGPSGAEGSGQQGGT